MGILQTGIMHPPFQSILSMLIPYALHGDVKMSVQATFRTTRTLVKEIENLVENGVYRNKTEAFNEGLRTIIRKHRADRAYKKILEIRKGTKEISSDLTEAVVRAHEEEDEL
jgi:Arc/MetJ-type ribon-helix-helix transcriptional regulator